MYGFEPSKTGVEYASNKETPVRLFLAPFRTRSIRTQRGFLRQLSLFSLLSLMKISSTLAIALPGTKCDALRATNDAKMQCASPLL